MWNLLFLTMKFHTTIRSFSREDTTFLKGAAILLIVLHNYYRWVIPVTGENEFWFDTLSISKSWIFLRSNPLEIFHVFFNFLGHYGVQAFIVISAYGLTLSYQKSHPRYGRFILHRFDKLYPSLILAGIAYIIVILFTSGNLIGMNTLKDLGIQFTLFGNLFPGKAMTISGPWWFYSFIFQFYLVFPLLMWIHRKTGWMGLAGLVILGYLFTILLYNPMNQASLNPYFTFMGHLPELCLGIFLASRDKVKLPWWAILLAIAVLVGGNIYSWIWPFANLAAAVLLVVSIQGLAGMKSRIKGFYSLITAIGGISMYLFAVHGFLRSPFLGLANTLESSVTTLVIGILFVAVASGVAYLLMNTEAAVRGWISSARSSNRSMCRLLTLVILVAGGFSLLFAMEFSRQGKVKQSQEVTLFEGLQDFEAPIPGRWDLLSDSIVKAGAKSLVLDNDRSFSPGFTVYFDSISLEGLYALSADAWLFTSDPATSIHLVMEIWDRQSDTRIVWESEYLKPGTFKTGEWFQITFNYEIPAVFRHPDFYLKVYAWKPSPGTWFMDDLSLTLKARR